MKHISLFEAHEYRESNHHGQRREPNIQPQQVISSTFNSLIYRQGMPGSALLHRFTVPEGETCVSALNLEDREGQGDVAGVVHDAVEEDGGELVIKRLMLKHLLSRPLALLHIARHHEARKEYYAHQGVAGLPSQAGEAPTRSAADALIV